MGGHPVRPQHASTQPPQAETWNSSARPTHANDPCTGPPPPRPPVQALPPPPCQCPAVTTTSLYAHALLPPTWPAPTWASPAWALTDSRALLASTLPHCLHPPTTPSTSHRLLASCPSGRSCRSVSSYANCDFSCTARAIRRGPIDPWHLHQCHHRALHLGHCPHHCQGHRGCCQDMNVLRPSLESMSVPRWMPSPPTCRGQVLPPRLLHQSFRPRSSPTSTLRWSVSKTSGHSSLSSSNSRPLTTSIARPGAPQTAALHPRRPLPHNALPHLLSFSHQMNNVVSLWILDTLRRALERCLGGGRDRSPDLGCP